MTFKTMLPYEFVMLLCGVALFLFALGLITVLVRKGKGFGAATMLLAVAMAMIGFPAIKNLEIDSSGIKIDKVASDAFLKNPTDVTAANNYRKSLRELDDAVAKNKGQPLPTDVVSELKTTVKALSQRPNLPPEARIAQAHAELLLGNEVQAAAIVNAAVKAKPSLVPSIHANLQTLLAAPTR